MVTAKQRIFIYSGEQKTTYKTRVIYFKVSENLEDKIFSFSTISEVGPVTNSMEWQALAHFKLEKI